MQAERISLVEESCGGMLVALERSSLNPLWVVLGSI